MVIAAVAVPFVGACTDDVEDVSLPALGDPIAEESVDGEVLTPDRSPMTITRDDVDAGIAEFVPIAERAMADSGVPGMAVGVVHDDEVVWTQGFGVRRVGEPEKVDADSVFQLASLSKPVGSTVVAGLVGQGALDWDDPIVEYTPEFQLADPWVTQHVTVADMYSHRSGLPPHAGDLLEDLGFDRDAVLERLAQYPLDDFRSSYAYTNFGLTQGAVAAAAAAGGEWEELSESVLYEPLGMESTSSRFADYEAAPERAWTHMRGDDGVWRTGEVRAPDAQTPAGGVSSTVADMAQWMRLQLGNGTVDGVEVVDGAALDRTHTPHGLSGRPGSPESRVGSYGLGFNLGTDGGGRQRWSHSGAFALGAGTSVTMIPAERLGVVVLTNGTPIGLAESMVETLLDLILTGEVSRDWMSLYEPAFAQMLDPEVEVDVSTPVDDPTAARPLTDYVGEYDNDLYGPVEIAESDGGLTISLGPELRTVDLRHHDGDTFAMMPWGENGVVPSAVVFAGDDAGMTLWIEYLDREGLGTFRRSG